MTPPETQRRSTRDRRFFALGAFGILCAAVLVARTHTASLDRRYLPSPAAGIRVNVNTADLQTLALLHQIGPERARQIVDHRRRYGPFKGLSELVQVTGIGPRTVEGLVGQVCFHD